VPQTLVNHRRASVAGRGAWNWGPYGAERQQAGGGSLALRECAEPAQAKDDPVELDAGRFSQLPGRPSIASTVAWVNGAQIRIRGLFKGNQEHPWVRSR